jgi:predicted acylesterase/phospholipase RssA
MRRVTTRRDVAVVLSGGGMNGVLMEHGFMLRLRESGLWPRVGWIFGTSAGALVGAMAALERLDELERFLLTLQPEDTFRPNRLWRLPFLGLHEYALPQTIEKRIGDLTEVAGDLARCERELVVCATDASPGEGGPDARDYELVYSSKHTDPETMAQAILASAAISALVMPVRVGDLIATDGAWVRNFPLAHAYTRPGVRRIVAFRYIPQYPTIGTSALVRLRERLSRFGRVPPIRAFIEELREAEERDARGEPGHLPEMILRLTRAAIVRNTVIEERLAAEKDQSIHELARLRRDVRELVTQRVRGRRERARFLAELDEVFGAARFPFRHDRAIPRITVRASVTDVSLDAGRRDQREWTEEAKRALIRRGYELADSELSAADVEGFEAAEEAV